MASTKRTVAASSCAIPELACFTYFSPAVFIKGHDEAFVFNAGDGGVVPVLAGEHLVTAVLGLPPNVRVLRPIEPQQRHHHLTWTYL